MFLVVLSKKEKKIKYIDTGYVVVLGIFIEHTTLLIAYAHHSFSVAQNLIIYSSSLYLFPLNIKGIQNSSFITKKKELGHFGGTTKKKKKSGEAGLDIR